MITIQFALCLCRWLIEHRVRLRPCNNTCFRESKAKNSKLERENRVCDDRRFIDPLPANHREQEHKWNDSFIYANIYTLKQLGLFKNYRSYFRDKMSAHSSLDSILVELGDFGKYQSIVFGLVCVAVIMHSAVHIAYVFSAQDLEYR